MTRKQKDLERGPAEAIENVFRLNAPNLSRFMAGDNEDFHSLRLYNRGEHDVLGVAKRFSSAGDVEVLFGSGYDSYGALVSIESGLSSNRWRLDTPWSE